MELFFAIASTVVFQLGIVVFCFLKKTAKVRFA
jgi:hypothetical protein